MVSCIFPPKSIQGSLWLLIFDVFEVLALWLQAPNFDNIPIVFQNVKIVALQAQKSKLGKLGASRISKILTDFVLCV